MGHPPSFFWIPDSSGTAPGDDPGGASQQKAANTDKLGECVNRLFNVNMVSFTPANASTRQAGEFVGALGPGAKNYFTQDAPNPNVNFHIVAPLNFNTSQLTQYAANDPRNTQPVTGPVGGYSPPYSPFVTYLANDMPSAETLIDQVHELGHSLGRITGKQNSDPKTGERIDYGQLLQQCVF